MPLTTPRSVLGAAIAASLLLASPAMAKPADTAPRQAAPTSSLAGTVTPGQDMRGEHARDAAATVTLASPAAPTQDLRGEHARDAAATVTLASPAAPTQDLRGEHARDASRPPVTPAAPPATGAPKALPAVDGNSSRPDTWLLVALGLAGAVIVAAGTSGLVRARRIA